MKYKKIMAAVLSVTAAISMTGCFKGLEVAKPGSETSSQTSTVPKAVTSASSDSSQAMESTSQKVKKLFENSVMNRKSMKFTLTWLIESNLPPKRGSVISENIYDQSGKIEQSKGESSETYGGKTTKYKWYRTADKYATDKSGEMKVYDLKTLTLKDSYRFEDAIRLLLKNFSTTETSDGYVLKANINDPELTGTIMKYLGYEREEKGIWEGDLYIETNISKTTGIPSNILYSFSGKDRTLTDTGEVKFSNYNLVTPVEIPTVQP